MIVLYVGEFGFPVGERSDGSATNNQLVRTVVKFSIHSFVLYDRTRV